MRAGAKWVAVMGLLAAWPAGAAPPAGGGPPAGGTATGSPAAGGPAAAAGDAAREAARARFARGSELYAAGRYADAAVEFAAARAIKPLPAFDYNIGRCMERLERWAEAADAFERYLPAADAKERAELTERIAGLRARANAAAPVAPPTAAAPLAPPPRALRLRVASFAVGGFALALVGVGAGLVGSVAADVNGLDGECARRRCGDGDIAPLERRAVAGYVLVGVGAAAAAADAVLIGLWARERRRPPAHALVAPLPGGVAVGVAGHF